MGCKYAPDESDGKANTRRKGKQPRAANAHLVEVKVKEEKSRAELATTAHLQGEANAGEAAERCRLRTLTERG